MGQFEITGSKSIEVVPSKLNIHLSICISDEVEQKDIATSKDKFKSIIADITSGIKQITDKCDVSFNDIIFSEKYNQINQQKDSLLGKKKQNMVILNGNTNLVISTTVRDADLLTSILNKVIEPDNLSITYAWFSSALEDADKIKLEVLQEACKKCKSDAELIVESLGSEILGVDKVVYNSRGNLLDTDKVEYKAKTRRSNVELSANCCSCDSLSSDFGSDSAGLIDNLDFYNKSWAEGFVKDLLERKHTISDNVTVVFRIK